MDYMECLETVILKLILVGLQRIRKNSKRLRKKKCHGNLRNSLWHSDPLVKPPMITFTNFFLWLTCIQSFSLMHIFSAETHHCLIFVLYITMVSQVWQSRN